MRIAGVGGQRILVGLVPVVVFSNDFIRQHNYLFYIGIDTLDNCYSIVEATAIFGTFSHVNTCADVDRLGLEQARCFACHLSGRCPQQTTWQR